MKWVHKDDGTLCDSPVEIALGTAGPRCTAHHRDVMKPAAPVVDGGSVVLSPTGTAEGEVDDRPWLVITNLELGGSLTIALGSEEADRKAREGQGVAVFLSLTGPDYRPGKAQRGPRYSGGDVDI